MERPTKDDWGPGPWQDEPDRLEWADEATGLPCLARRGNPSIGSWCGYVAVPPGHPFHGKEYGECANTPPCEESYCSHSPSHLLDVHGGITFTGGCQLDPDGGICHTPAAGESDNVWWFGFDCGHFDDLMPGMIALDKMLENSPDWPKHDSPWMHGTYKTLGYVQNECQDLAQQLLAFADDAR